MQVAQAVQLAHAAQAAHAAHAARVVQAAVPAPQLLATQKPQAQQAQWQSGQAEPQGQWQAVAPPTPGRATARTQARALLRAKARARRREARTAELEERAQGGNGHCHGDDEGSLCGSVSGESHECCATSWPCPQTGFGSLGGLPVSVESADLGGFLCRGWEYPLTAAEKKERVVLLYEKEQVLAEQQVHHSDQRARHGEEEAKRLTQDMLELRFENRRLADLVRDLQLQLATVHKQQRRRSSFDVAMNPLHVTATASKQVPLTARAISLEPKLVAPAPSMPAAIQTPVEQAALAPASARLSPGCVPEPRRSLGLVTPRHGVALSAGQGMLTPRGSMPTGMRGSIASMTWTEGAPDVPWITLTSRISGAETTYGEKRDGQARNEEGTFSLRRGEYFTSVSGVFGAPPALALCLRVVTSEFQEVNIGAEDLDMQLDFAFEASPGFEIVGLYLGEDEAIAGIRQTPLAPSRVAAQQQSVLPSGSLLSQCGWAGSCSNAPTEQSPVVMQAAQPPVYEHGMMSRRSVSPIKETLDEFIT